LSFHYPFLSQGINYEEGETLVPLPQPTAGEDFERHKFRVAQDVEVVILWAGAQAALSNSKLAGVIPRQFL